MICYCTFPCHRDYPEFMLIQQDGAPPHFAHIVRYYLYFKTSEPLDRTGRTNARPVQSPDLTHVTTFYGNTSKRTF